MMELMFMRVWIFNILWRLPLQRRLSFRIQAWGGKTSIPRTYAFAKVENGMQECWWKLFYQCRLTSVISSIPIIRFGKTLKPNLASPSLYPTFWFGGMGCNLMIGDLFNYPLPNSAFKTSTKGWIRQKLIGCFQKAIQINPDIVEAYHNLHVLLRETKLNIMMLIDISTGNYFYVFSKGMILSLNSSLCRDIGSSPSAPYWVNFTWST